ncbi:MULTISPECIES: transcriptional regulator GutM [Priestia]|uniref:transcriptional regulator GutM n=1 Tax=Priestia TaxID=2800373 RepID=UPI002E1EA678|nr:transcriptional regulator GutM [Priestia aryabhattai]
MNLVILLCFLLIVQYGFTFIQMKYYRKSMDKIVRAYKGKEGYYFSSGMERRKLRPGAIAMIVVDKDYIVQECYVVNGFSVLSKFKELRKYKGQHAGAILDTLGGPQTNKSEKFKRFPAIHIALTKAAENALLSISKKNISMI